MSKTETFYYDKHDFKRDVPDLEEYELDDLAFYYPSYGLRWRPFIIKGLKEGKDYWEIVEDKLTAMDAESKKQEAQDGLKGNICYKLQRAAMRIQYLRRREKGKSRTISNREARRNHFPHIKTDTFEVNTRGCTIDKKE